MKIICNSQKAYKWYSNQDLYFRGYFFWNETFYSGEDAIEWLNDIGQEKVTGILPELNGIFSIVLCYGSSVLLACDRLRGLPLFYSVHSGDIIISDMAKSILNEYKTAKVNVTAYNDYASSSLFVSGYDTLVDGIFQVQAAEYVLLDSQSCSIDRHEYYRYESNVSEHVSVDQLKDSFFVNYRMIGNRLVKALRGRTAVIPLSGGADSRMVVSMLKEQNYKNVICFTYGIKGNSEARMSKEVADYYGYPWTMVEYSAKMWDDLQNSELLKQYEEYATNYVSTMHIQDIMAIAYLKEHHIIPQDSVFIPGHSGDMIAGSHLTDDFLTGVMDYEHFIKCVLSKFYPKGCPEDVACKIRAMFSYVDETSAETLSREFEWFNVKERQAKFIVNSVRAYEFIGHEWLIPLWDNSQFEFWSTVPVELRYDRKLYFECVHDNIRSTNDKTELTELTKTIRNTPVINNIARRVYRIKRFYSSKLGFEHMFSFKEYMTACLTMYPTFTINDLLCNRRLKQLKKELSIKG